jgi:uncharacterized protein (DUF2235 family)
MFIAIAFFIGVFIGWLVFEFIWQASRPESVSDAEEDKNIKYGLGLTATLLQEEYERSQRNSERTIARHKAMNDALVKEGHCPRGHLFFNADGTSAGFEGMMLSQEEWDKSKLGKLYRKWHLEEKRKAKKQKGKDNEGISQDQQSIQTPQG